MNYRHAYHAGNHTEVFKHAVLALILDRLRQKPAPFMMLDTHAGLGLYDLNSPEALKTGEAAAGIGTVLAAGTELPGPYLAVVRPFVARGLYPGSPAIAAAMLRGNDRIVACELHPDDVAVLRRNFRDDRRVAVHHRDGYEALFALIPPPERRGLVFVDPPYEKTDEAERLGRTLVAAVRKWPTGVFAAWYPVKDPMIGRAVARPLVEAGVPGCLKMEVLRYPVDGERLAGSGMIVVGPPWQLDGDMKALGADLLPALSSPAGRVSVDWLTAPT